MAKNEKIHQMSNGSKLILKLPTSLYTICCDCGLVHLFVLDEAKKGEISFTTYRDDIRTEEERKSHRYKK